MVYGWFSSYLGFGKVLVVHFEEVKMGRDKIKVCSRGSPRDFVIIMLGDFYVNDNQINKSRQLLIG